MSKFGDVLKGGMMGGLVGAAKAGGIGINDIARHGGFGLTGLALAKKKRPQEAADIEAAMKKKQFSIPGGGRRPLTPGDIDAMIGRSAQSDTSGMKKGGKVKKMAKGGSASRRGDGCATQGKTRGKFV